MLALEPVLEECKPDVVLVYGDVNSTAAAALVCSKLGIRVGHVEAGLRSHDRTMPEEINRLLTDQLSDFLFTPSADGDENLAHEGVDPAKIHRVGNVMIDTLVRLLACADGRLPPGTPPSYALVTLHRPSNVDDLPWLRDMLATLTDLSRELQVVFPVHPRTHLRLRELAGATNQDGRLVMMPPLPYLEFLALQRGATMVITDSGGIQEETTFLGVPCLTVRENTERPVTISHGTNQLVGRDLKRIHSAAMKILRSTAEADEVLRQCHIPLWDGHAAERIAAILRRNSALPPRQELLRN
jgi:UDP-N-acetylglucosamine 2-epimerase (non-hydrolysing)